MLYGESWEDLCWESEQLHQRSAQAADEAQELFDRLMKSCHIRDDESEDMSAAEIEALERDMEELEDEIDWICRANKADPDTMWRLMDETHTRELDRAYQEALKRRQEA